MRVADHETRVLALDLVELGGVGDVGDDVPGTAPVDAIGQIHRAERGGRGHDDRTELHDREHGLPEFDLVVQHEDDSVCPGHSVGGQMGGDLIGPACEFVEGVLRLGAVLFHDPQGHPVVAPCDRIEPVHGPVEPLPEIRPGELVDRLAVVAAEILEQIACRPVELGCPAVGRKLFRIRCTRDTGCVVDVGYAGHGSPFRVCTLDVGSVGLWRGDVSAHAAAAVHTDHLSGNEAGFRAKEIGDGPGDFVGNSGAAHRNESHRVLDDRP